MVVAMAHRLDAVDPLPDRCPPLRPVVRGVMKNRARKNDPSVTATQVHEFVQGILGEDLHARRVLSLANAVTGAVHAAALSIHAIGAALAAVSDLNKKHAVKQVDRMLSNVGIAVEELFPMWVAFVRGARKKMRVALDWTDFEKDDQVTLAAYLITEHGRATPLAWKTYAKSTLAGNQSDHEAEFIDLLDRVIPEHAEVTIVADRGFASVERYGHLDFLGFKYVIRFRGDIQVTGADGTTQTGNAWVPPKGRVRRIEDARVTAAEGVVPVVICVKKAKMKDSWCLATNHAELTSAEIINLYGRRFTIEETFRDVKDQRFGMGLRATSIRQPERRDRLLFVAALAHALLSLLGAAGERLGLDRMLKVNTSKTRQLSLYRQGLFWYQALPNMREERFAALMTAYSEIIQEHAVMRKVFGVL